MDILAIPPAGSSAPLNNTASNASGDGSFARTLEQAIGQNTPAATPPARSSAGTKNSAGDNSASKDARPVSAEAATSQAQRSADKQPEPSAQAQTTQQQASAAENTNDTLVLQPPLPPTPTTPALDQPANQLAAVLPTVSPLAGAGNDASGASPSANAVQREGLDEIRRRLALIEQAGKLPEDASANSGLAALAAAIQAQQAAAPQPAVAQSQAAGTAVRAASTSGVTTTGTLLDALAGAHPQAKAETAAAPGTALRATDVGSAQSGTASNLAADAGTAQNGTADSLTAIEQPLLDATPNKPTHIGELPPGQDLALANLGAAASAITSAPPSTTAGSMQPIVLGAPVGSSEWQQGLGQQLVGLYHRGDKQIDLHLHPADLGPLSISLKLADSGAQAQFISAHPQVRAAVEQALPELRAALASQGINLGEASVGGQQQPDREAQANQGGSPRGMVVEAAGDAGSEAGDALSIPLRVGRGQVDLYA
ncbi:MAG TPA: flagellar hook-length control protein FliK [Pseudomonas sp.]|nr:flagellar hook-length control protein FliK [Pseudomonas sp.]